MPTTLDNVLLDVLYSALADGGPEFATAIVRAGSGGAVASRNENREDYISKYEITFGELMKPRRKELRSFGILRRGMARGFRFLPPDDYELENEKLGVLNSATLDIDVPAQTSGTTTTFYVIKNFRDAVTNYTRWIVCPSPLDDLKIDIYASSNLTTPEKTGYFPGGYIYAADGSAGLPSSRSINIAGYGTVAVYYGAGRIIFSTAPPSGKVIKISGAYHLPVAFTEDWHKFSVDDGGIAEIKVSLEEILPIELGLSPEIGLTGDVTAPTVSLELI